MIRYFLAKGDRAGDAVITEGLPGCTCSDPPPRVEIATLYMKTYCYACKQAGFIAPQGPRWAGTGPNGKPWALSGDINVCGCKPSPVFHAMRSMKMTFTSEDIAQWNTASTQSRARERTSLRAEEPPHTCRFYVWDSSTGKALSNRDFVADVGGSLQRGRTDGDGYATITSDGSQQIKLHVIFHSPKRELTPILGT